jgi:MscS family membrane protein
VARKWPCYYRSHLALHTRRMRPDESPRACAELLCRIVAFLITCVAAFPCHAADPSWTGSWDTRWRDGGARLELKQDGSLVTGTYPLYGGRIEAEAKGQTLQGRWIEGPRSGGFLFVLSPDSRYFMGRFDNGEWWTGARATAATREFKIDQTSPRETLRTFVLAGNLARQGLPEAMGQAVAIMDFAEAGPTIPPGHKLEMASALFDLVDSTTFRIWSLPDSSLAADVVTVSLKQSGTDAELPLNLRRTADRRWWILPPASADMERYRQALFARSNGKPPPPDAYKQLGSPRDTMRAFLSSFSGWDAGGREGALQTLDLSQFPVATREQDGELVTQYLARVLDKIGIVTLQEIPDDPASRATYIHFNHPAGRIAIAPVSEAGATRWKFAPDTVANVDDLYSALQDMPPIPGAAAPPPASVFFALRQHIRELSPMLVERMGVAERWQFVGIGVVMAACLLAGSALAWALRRILHPAIGKHVVRAGSGSTWPLRFFLALLLWQPASEVLGLPEVVRAALVPAISTLIAVAGLLVGWRLITILGITILARARRKSGALDEIVVSLSIGAVRLLLIVVAALYIANAFSLPTNSIIAGFGISGIAVAFAAKETLSNVFGAGILVADRPFRRDDWIAAGAVEGTVEHVGIRSTRLRTIEDTVIVVPNGKLADATINNWGSRRHRLVCVKLLIAYGIKSEHLSDFVDTLRNVVADGGHGVSDRTNVGVTGLGETGVQVELTTYVNASDQAEEWSAKQSLMLDILRRAERMGIQLGLNPPEIALRARAPARA